MECPKCKIPFQTEDINIQKDIALCKSCSKVYSITQDLGDIENLSLYSKNELEEELRYFDITNPPDRNTWVRQTTHGMAIGASMRSNLAYVFLAFILVFGGISGIIFSAFVVSGDVETEVFLFFIPFFLVDLVMSAFFVVSFFGKVEVTMERFEGDVFVGAFGLGWRKRFQVKDINRIIEAYSGVEINNVRKKHIVIETDQGNYAFGALLANPRRTYVFLALNKYLYQLNKKRGK